MNSLAHLPRLDRIVHLSRANVDTERDGAGWIVLKALALGVALIGIAAGVMVVMAVIHEGIQ